MTEIFQVGDVVESTERWISEVADADDRMNSVRMVTLEPGDVGVVKTTSPHGVSVLMLRLGVVAWFYWADLSSLRLVEGQAVRPC